MTNEEMQRAMEFIVEQQAQFAASIQRAEEERIRDTPRLTRLEESFRSFAEFARSFAEFAQSVAELAQITEGRLDNLEKQRVQDNERIIRLEDSFVLLTHLAQKTDVRLDRLEHLGG